MDMVLRQSLLTGNTVDETFRQAEELEIELLEWDVDTLYDVDPLWQPAGRRALIRRQGRQGIRIELITLGQLNRTGLAHPDEEVRRFAVRFTGEGMRHAAEVGAAMVALPFYGATAWEEPVELDRAAAAVSRVLHMAQTYELDVALETELDAARLQRLLRKIHGGPVSLVYDVARAFLAGRDVTAELRSLWDMICLIRLGDGIGRHHDVRPGRGRVQLDDVLRLMDHHNYAGLVAVEGPGGDLDGLRQSLKHICSQLHTEASRGA